MKIKDFQASVIFIFFILLLSFAIAGCGGGSGGSSAISSGGGGDTPGSPTPDATTNISVQGIVTVSNGGAALSGSSVTAGSRAAKNERTSATTDSSGNYSLLLSEGEYDITASKSGYASSKIQGFTAESNSSYTGMNLIQFRACNPDWSVQAPSLNVSGITANQTVSGSITAQVSVSGDNPTRLIEVHIGNKTSTADFSIADSDSLSFTWDSTLYPPPANGSYFYIVAYDVNFNRVETTIPIITGTTSITVLQAPTDIMARSYTFSSDLGLFAEKQAMSMKKRNLKSDSSIYVLPNGEKVDLKNVPASTTIFVRLTWTKAQNAKGYRIYRSTDPNGTYTHIGDSLNGSYVEFDDIDPSLAIGETYYYKISSYNSQGESQQASVPATKILNRFIVNLASPGDRSTGISLTPEFSWNVLSGAGTKQQYKVAVYGNNDSSYAWTKTVYSTTTASGATLDKNKVYQWDLETCYALDCWNESLNKYLSYSFASPNGNSTTGAYTFTTAP